MSSTAEGLFLAMSLYPEIQEKARAELSTVVGPDRMPGFKDRKSLVYVNAIVKEALRWHNVTPIGVLHTTTADEVLRGHFIPSGTMIAPNIWCGRVIVLLSGVASDTCICVVQGMHAQPGHLSGAGHVQS